MRFLLTFAALLAGLGVVVGLSWLGLRRVYRFFLARAWHERKFDRETFAAMATVAVGCTAVVAAILAALLTFSG